MNKAADTFTHIDNPEDRIYLKSKAFPVNIRLFNSDVGYRSVITHCCDLIRRRSLDTYEDYKKPHGMSGANLAIPFNIIGFVDERDTTRENVIILINPEIIETNGRVITKSNCGSIRLKNPIKVRRHAEITVKYFNEQGKEMRYYFHHTGGGTTIQHEIDHNNGILITDREVK